MGSRTHLVESKIRDTRWTRGMYQETMVLIGPADNTPIPANAPPVIAIDPGGAGIDILMPADDASLKGLTLTIINLADAAETITLKTSADAALTPAVAVTQNNAVTMVHLGGTGLTGWRRTDSL